MTRVPSKTTKIVPYVLKGATFYAGRRSPETMVPRDACKTARRLARNDVAESLRGEGCGELSTTTSHREQ